MAGPKLKDLTGRKFNNFTVLRLSINQPCKTHRYWDCVCICGNHRSVSSSNLGKIKGCGCVIKEYERTGKYAGQKKAKPKIKPYIKAQCNFVITSAKPLSENQLKAKRISEEQARIGAARRNIELIKEQREINDYFEL